MPIPSKPSFSQVPNNFSELLNIQKNFFRKFSSGLTNVTKVTNLNKFRSLAAEKKAIANQKRALANKKAVESATKVTDNLKKGNFKKVNRNLGNAIGFALSLASIGLSMMTINHVGKLQEIQLSIEGVILKDLSAAFQRAINNTLNIRKIREEFNKFRERFQQQEDRFSTEIDKVDTLSKEAKQQANDALYEVRAGREKVESKILDVRQLFNQLSNETAFQNLELAARVEEARKLGNDALYEVRAGRQTIEAEIQSKFTAARQLANDALYEARVGRQKLEANFGRELNSLRTVFSNQIAAVRLNTQKEVNNLFNKTNNIVADATRQIRLAEKQSHDFQRQLSSLERKFRLLPNNNSSSESNLEPLVNRLINSNPRIQGLLAALKAANVKLNGHDIVLAAHDKAIKNIGYSVQIVDGKITKLEKGVKLEGLNITNTRLTETERAIDRSNLEIEKIKKQFENGSPMDQKQFNEIVSRIGLIPPLIARVPDNTVRKMPKPLTTGQVQSATSSAICSSANGGCMSNALGNTANTINRNTNNVGNGLLNKINAGANAGQLALLTKIDGKLGAQIAGGLSGAVKNIFANKLVDRALQVANLTGTLHNALMLSNNLGQTLFGATDNLLNAVGVKIKDEKGTEIGIQQVVNSLLLNFANSLFGVENVNSMSNAFKKANRVYQSTANIVDSVRTMTDSVKNVAEFTAENTGKIGNALKTYQVIAPDAYQWMPEQVNAQSIWTKRLENLEEAASAIEMVSGEVLSITQNAAEIKQQLDEFNKAVEDLPPKERNDNKPIIAKKIVEKTASTHPQIPEISGDADKEADAA